MVLEDEWERGPWSAAKQKHNCAQQAGHDSHSPQCLEQRVDAEPCAWGQSVWAHLMRWHAVVGGVSVRAADAVDGASADGTTGAGRGTASLAWSA